MQGRTRGTDIENKFTDTKGRKEECVELEIEVNIYTLLWIKSITNENLLDSTGNSSYALWGPKWEKKNPKMREYAYT